MATGPDNLRTLALLALAAAAVSLSAPAEAHPVDARRTQTGQAQHFSVQQFQPPPPSVYGDEPITDDVTMTAWRLSEPGLNHRLPAPLGLVLFHGSGGSRPRWVIYDMLAWKPVRHLLYEDPGPWMAEPSRIDGPALQHLPRAGSTNPPSPEPQSPTVIPLPTTAMLMAAGVMALLPRRPRRTAIA
jgi:hypothetical protein